MPTVKPDVQVAVYVRAQLEAVSIPLVTFESSGRTAPFGSCLRHWMRYGVGSASSSEWAAAKK